MKSRPHDEAMAELYRSDPALAEDYRGLTEQARWWVRTNPDFYQQLARRHAAGVTPAG